MSTPLIKCFLYYLVEAIKKKELITGSKIIYIYIYLFCFNLIKQRLGKAWLDNALSPP
jgi:hypothetical protein